MQHAALRSEVSGVSTVTQRQTLDPTSLGAQLRKVRLDGRKALIVYVTAGLPNWVDTIHAVVGAGADLVEVGIPFSDPVMDGPVIQQASQRALELGATPSALLAELADASVDAPTVVMTYANIVASPGYSSFANQLGAAGVRGAIIPDLPFDECAEWAAATDAVDVSNILLVAPTTPDQRLGDIAFASRGFVYAVGLLGVTGERASVAETSLAIGKRVKAVTDHAVYVGLGVSNGEGARLVADAADGVIVGSALVRRMMEGQSGDEIGEFISQLRNALDAS
jgi:tryptophan synthase alpha chain